MSRLPDPPNSTSEHVSRRLGFLINFAYFGIIIAIALLVVSGMIKWMLPFVFAFIVATILQRPLNWMVKKTRVSIKFFSVVCVVLIILLIAGAIIFIGWRLFVGLTAFFSNQDNIDLISGTVTNTSTSLQQLLENISGMLPEEMITTMQTTISSITEQIMDFVTSLFKNATGWAANVITSLPMLLLSFIMWVAASIFLTIDYKKVTTFIFNQVPERHRELVNEAREMCTDTLFKLARAYALLMFITFIELFIGLSIMRIPHAIVLALLISFVDILPVLGTGTVVLPWAVLSLAMGDVNRFIGLVLMYVVILVVRNIIEPRVVSNQIGLNPLVTLFFMFLGLQVLGIVGMMAFPVIVMVLVQLQSRGKIKIWK